MSVSRSARCLLRQSQTWSSSIPVSASKRLIHQSSKQQKSDSSNASPKVKASPPVPRQPQNASSTDNGSVPITQESASKYFPPYTAEEMEFIKRKYTPEQMKALEAGEAAVDPMDLLKQGVVRNDYMRIKYLDDFRNYHPVLDKKQMAPESNYDPNMRLKTDDEIDEDLAAFWEDVSKTEDENDDSETELKFEKFMQNFRYTVGREEAERDAPDYRAPELNKLTDPIAKRAVPSEDEDASSTDVEFWSRLSAQTGLSQSYMKGLRTKTLVYNGVTNQTRLGKIHSIYVMVVCGNEAGLLGVGAGKSTEIEAAEQQALGRAIRSMVPIPRYEGRTIYGDTTGKVGATVVKLFNRPPGFGIRCQEKIYYMCKCAGITDLAARVPRSRNPMNTVKAAFEALTNQRLPDVVARGRGRKMIDVRKVYYAGMN